MDINCTELFVDGKLLSKEYFEIVRIISDFDQRLLMIKGWGVTLSLAIIVLGIQRKSREILLVAAISSMSFWLLEGITKGHQMRYYPRMQELEVACYEKLGGPHIDASWMDATSAIPGAYSAPPDNKRRTRLWLEYSGRWFLPAVTLPHALTFVVSLWFAWGVHRAEIKSNDK
jgi:hypothetical protein